MVKEPTAPLRLPLERIKCLPRLKITDWIEYVGEYIGSAIEDDIFHFAIQMNDKQYRITVPVKSDERGILEVVEILDDNPFQKRKKKIRLGILFTDDPKQPIRLRRIM